MELLEYIFFRWKRNWDVFLKQKECVHHKDEDKLNYDLNNLMCFRTNSDHIAFHHGNVAYKNEEGIYFCKERKRHFCLNCKKEIECRSTLCNSCYKKELDNARGCSIPSKEQLLKDIKTMSFVSIGQKYNVSDNAIRKWCKKYNLPYRKTDIKILLK